MPRATKFLAIPMVVALGGCSVQPPETAPTFTPVVYTQHTAEEGVCEKVTQVVTSFDQFGTEDSGFISVPNIRTTTVPAPCDLASKPYEKPGTMRMVPVAKAPVEVEGL